jgi:class 3 adenylate cyclase
MNIENRLHGTQYGQISQEFFTNTAHFPMANLLLEILLEGTGKLWLKLLVFLLPSLMQAYYLGTCRYYHYPRPLLGNLIAPAFYTFLEINLYGYSAINPLNHTAYWIFAILIGLLQELQLHIQSKSLVILENLIRTNILLAMYWIFEATKEPRYFSAIEFFQDDAHLFLTLAINFIGIMMGIAYHNAESSLQLLRQTTQQLQCYSEWFLGKSLLEQAVADPATLTLNRRQRAVLFMDIRGFTHWSELQSPEAVVRMLNRYCEIAEQTWYSSHEVIKAKLTGDEIMIVFQSPHSAVMVANELRTQIAELLAEYGLGIGIGIHWGPLVEGLIGSHKVKAYDISGDTVNTAKRLCDVAMPSEILISHSVYELVQPVVGTPRHLKVKGKTEDILVYPLSTP